MPIAFSAIIDRKQKTCIDFSLFSYSVLSASSAVNKKNLVCKSIHL